MTDTGGRGTGNQCARQWEIDPYREGRLGAKDARSFERHLRSCAECREQMEADLRLRELARALPVVEPSELALRRVRTRVMRDSATGVALRQAPRWLGVGVASMVVVASAATWALVAHRSGSPAPLTATTGTTAGTVVATAPKAPADVPEPEVLAGDVVATADARWTQARAHGVERVGLQDGAMAVHVRQQAIGERFLVTLPDGELEVRGTTFEVNVAQGATTRVHVDEGVVELRLRGQPPRRLLGGETWTAPAAADAVRPAAPSVQPSSPSAAAPAPDGVDGYTAAMGLLRSGRNDEAAAAFHTFVQSQPRAAQAEDASFLEAVALARAGRTDAAALAAEHHLAGFPGSFHRREAAILVARAAVQRGDCGKARTVLATWTTGEKPDAEAQGALRGCPGG